MLKLSYVIGLGNDQATVPNLNACTVARKRQVRKTDNHGLLGLL